MYDEGWGVNEDNSEAAKWYRLAAEQGHSGAQANLGVMYANGEGLPHDFVKAHMWSSLAAAQGVAEAMQNRDIIAGLMSPEQVAEAERLAREWKPHRE
jgi:TPR repeat protein